MPNEISCLFSLDVLPGRFEAFKQLVSKIVAATGEESDTLAYEYSVTEDLLRVTILEHYRNSEALVSHVEETFAPFAERFLSYATVRELKVHGAPSEAARALLDWFGASYLHPFDGFWR
jgi:quinol monooxygenase YgiN